MSFLLKARENSIVLQSCIRDKYTSLSENFGESSLSMTKHPILMDHIILSEADSKVMSSFACLDASNSKV